MGVRAGFPRGSGDAAPWPAAVGLFPCGLLDAGRDDHAVSGTSGGLPLALDVAQPIELPGGAVAACDQALLGSVRFVLTGTVISFVSVDTGLPGKLIWPHGFAAWLVNGKAEIVAPDGTLIGVSGDVLSGLGGGGGPGNAFTVCAINNRSYP